MLCIWAALLLSVVFRRSITETLSVYNDVLQTDHICPISTQQEREGGEGGRVENGERGVCVCVCVCVLSGFISL